METQELKHKDVHNSLGWVDRIRELKFRDVINVRDLIGRFEELELETRCNISFSDKSEMAFIAEILSELKGECGGEQWRGDRYPIALIRESYFRDYTQELDRGCPKMPKASGFTHIDWFRVAANLQKEYKLIKIDCVRFWYR